MDRRTIKKKVFKILQLTERAEVRKQLESLNPRDTVNPLFSALCATNETVRWNSIYCFGFIVPAIRSLDGEAGRIIMRRFLWSLNDESGGIGWGAPEAMSEIMAHDDQLANEYLHMLLSYMKKDGPELFADGNFLELPMLQRGVLWGVARLCETRRELLLAKGVVEDLVAYLISGDGHVRGLAIWCLLSVKDKANRETVQKMVEDTSPVEIYRDGALLHCTVGEIAGLYVRGGDVSQI